jgi:hypothetical protein
LPEQLDGYDHDYVERHEHDDVHDFEQQFGTRAVRVGASQSQ